MLINHQHTKIIATLGPSSRHPDVINALIRAGADGFRMNFSHISGPEEAQMVVDMVRSVCRQMEVWIPILADIQGPKLRVGRMPGEGVLLRETRPYTLYCGEMEEGNDEMAPCEYVQLAHDVKPGTRILLADGTIELEVGEIKGSEVRCTVVNGGRLYSRKGINVPRTSLSAQTLTDKDIADLEYIASSDIDMVAISFVRKPEDIAQARHIIGQTRKHVPVMAKLELPEVLERLDKILDASDGVMIARGDLAVEVPFEQVPRLQKQILERARAKGKWAMVATQMLGSMVMNVRPTRAEVSDVANAMLDGADAMMLSEETAAGSHPLEAVQAMTRIAEETEQMLTPPDPDRVEVDTATFDAGAAQAAVGAAKRLHAKAIVALAGSGTTALSVSKWQPKMPIIALSAKDATLRRLSVLRGVIPVQLPGIMTLEEQLRIADRYLVDNDFAAPGDVTVALAAVPLGMKKETNTIRFHHVRSIEQL